MRFYINSFIWILKRYMGLERNKCAKIFTLYLYSKCFISGRVTLNLNFSLVIRVDIV